jgi:hypothetical protein
MTATGGVHTTVTGIVRGTTTGVGLLIQVPRVFIARCPGTGGKTTINMNGKASLGNTNASPTNKFKRTGMVGKRIIIGKKIRLGESRDIMPIRKIMANNPRPIKNQIETRCSRVRETRGMNKETKDMARAIMVMDMAINKKNSREIKMDDSQMEVSVKLDMGRRN